MNKSAKDWSEYAAETAPATAPKHHLSQKEGAAYLGISTDLLSKLIRNGEVPAAQLGDSGRVVRVRRDDLDKLIEDRTIRPRRSKSRW
jgi:excisionase family DNA binding protein